MFQLKYTTKNIIRNKTNNVSIYEYTPVHEYTCTPKLVLSVINALAMNTHTLLTINQTVSGSPLWVVLHVVCIIYVYKCKQYYH